MFKLLSALSFALVISFSLMGCSKHGIDFANKAPALGECILFEHSDCNPTLSNDIEMTIEKASLFAPMDSVRISAKLKNKQDCLSAGNTAGRTPNSLLVINDAIIMQYGLPGQSFSYLEQICDESNSFLISLTIAKST